MLGLLAYLLAGESAGLPQLFPGPGHPLTGMSKNTPARNIPFAGWRALPALGAMQEPIPDFRFALHNT